MKNLILTLCRRYALRQNRSTVPTSLLNLKEVKDVTVYVDVEAVGEDPEQVCRSVRQFFDRQGIPVRILCAQKKDLNLLGYLKARVRGSRKEPRHEDMFISLATSPEHFASEFEARCSTARFKVGCCALPGGVYDLVVTPPEGVEASQTAAFSAVKAYLDKIQ
ncbi:MAG: hypothetical protein K6E35_02155 [Bacteroidales bacterium]|nr:hypothetical protein [Bacteroidales bacterium]